MTEASFDAERRTDQSSKDLELVLYALQEAMAVIDQHDPDRNPARCMRQLRRLFNNPNLRAAVGRLSSDNSSPSDEPAPRKR